MGYDRRRIGLTTACCGLLTLGGLTAHPAFAQATEATDKVVSLDVAAGDLHAVVLTLERQTRLQRPGARRRPPLQADLRPSGRHAPARRPADHRGERRGQGQPQQ